MSNVTLAIGGRNFVVACADGEESHVAQLGLAIDRKVTANGVISQNETRMLLFAALMLADELHEARAELAAATQAHAQDEAAGSQIEQRISEIGLRLEALAQQLEAAS